MRRHLLYGSYTDKSNEVLQTGAGLMRERVRNILIAVLIVGIAALGIIGGRAMAYQTEARGLFVATLQTECNEALSLSNSLSRTAGANSSATLGRIRANLHAMEIANRFHLMLDGRAYLPDETFSDLYTLLDNYSSRLLTGMNTGDLQGDLQTALEGLRAKVDEL